MTSGPSKPVLAVGAVVVVDGHLLLVRRARPPAEGLWAVPGGRVEGGESVEEAVEREVLEETGLSVSCGPLVGWIQRSGPNFNYVILDFEASPTATRQTSRAEGTLPVLRAGDDASEAVWVGLSDVSRIDLVPGLREFLAEHNVVPSQNHSSSSEDSI